MTFDFSELFLTTVGDHPKTLSFTTTAELPQTIGYVLCNSTISGTTTVATLMSVSTYVGPEDICAMDTEEFHSEILDPCHQTGAATLVAPIFGRPTATLDTSVDEANRNVVLLLAFPAACEEIKVTSCPGWNHRPASIFENIKQVITDENVL